MSSDTALLRLIVPPTHTNAHTLGHSHRSIADRCRPLFAVSLSPCLNPFSFFHAISHSVPGAALPLSRSFRKFLLLLCSWLYPPRGKGALMSGQGAQKTIYPGRGALDEEKNLQFSTLIILLLPLPMQPAPLVLTRSGDSRLAHYVTWYKCMLNPPPKVPRAGCD